VALDASDNPCLFGEFDCRMDEYSVLAGGTGMFNSVGFHDLFITQYDKNGNRQWARNFGGPMYDKAHGIVFSNNPTPYVCGSFQKVLNVNTSYTFNVLSQPLLFYYSGWVSYQNCNNNNSHYHGAKSAGFSDCFIMHGIDSTCAYYDYYYRSGGGCQQNFVKGCIDDYTWNCQDTINLCHHDSIIANPYTGSIGQVGPLYHYLWGTGDTMRTHYVTTSNNYSCIMTTLDGCFNTQDTVYAKINPSPQPPTITDSYSVNVNQPPATHSVSACGGAVTLTGGNLQGCNYQWTEYSNGIGVVSTNGTSCVVNKTDTFYFILTNSYGCRDTNKIFVKIDTIYHIIPKTNMPDTFKICQGQCIDNYFIYDSITNPTAQSYTCFTTLTNVITGNTQVTGEPYPVYNCLPNNLSLKICPTSTGLINLHIMYIFSSSCGKDTTYFNKPIYVIIYPNPQVSLSVTGNNFICPGDSTLLVATVTVTPTTNVTYTISPSSSLWVNQAAYYQFGVYAFDTLTRCYNNYYSGINVQTVNNPIIHTLPANGLVCPNDSVELICTWPGAVSWQWHGPTGILPPNTSYIYDSIPGFYYCVPTNSSGCILTSNTVEIKKYNTPYLLALPQTVVCAGQLITLNVISNDTTLIQWLPPLSGGGTSRTVSQSGTYSCKVTMCGITTTCNITVTIAQPIAHISVADSLTICPGDSALLSANPGLASYLWLPNNQFSNSIYAYASDTYILIATDGNGCQATDSVKVIYNPNAPPAPITTNDSICIGYLAHLQAATSGNYTVEWYAQPYSGSIINIGNNYVTPSLNQNTSYYVSVKDSAACHSIRQTANVFIKPTSLLPLIWGDTLLCFGDTLHLNTNYIGGASYSWSGPNTFSSSVINPQINQATSNASGTYSLSVSGSDCISSIATHSVIVIQLSVPSIITLDSVCQFTSLILQGQSSDTGVSYNWSGPDNFLSSNQTNTINPINSINAGIYYLQTISGNCKSQVDSIYVFVKSTPIPQISSISTSCIGDSVNLFSQTMPGASTNWVGPNGFSSNIANPVIIHLDSSKAGYYCFISTLNGCTGKDSVKITANPLPRFYLGNDTTICGSQPLLLYPGHFSNYLWNNSVTDTSFTFNNSGQITLMVSNQYGCRYFDTLNIIAAQCRLVSPNIFTPNEDGINDIYYFKIDDYEKLEFIIYDRWGILVYKNMSGKNGWDGTNNLTKKQVDEGVYFYEVNSKNMLGVNASNHGFIQVIR
jgi:gliding motility-associated-like protein